MKSITVNNLEVGYRKMGAMHAVSWDDGKARYHYWTAREDLEAEDDIIYKNPMMGVGYREPGYFDTRKLSASAQANFGWVECVAEAARDAGLLAKARAEAEAKKRAEEDERRANTMRRITERHGPALFTALAAMISDDGWLYRYEAIRLIARINDELNAVR